MNLIWSSFCASCPQTMQARCTPRHHVNTQRLIVNSGLTPCYFCQLCIVVTNQDRTPQRYRAARWLYGYTRVGGVRLRMVLGSIREFSKSRGRHTDPKKAGFSCKDTHRNGLQFIESFIVFVIIAILSLLYINSKSLSRNRISLLEGPDNL